MAGVKFTVCLLAVWLLSQQGLWPQEAVSVSGNYKSFFTVFRLPDYRISGQTETSPPLGSVSNKIGLSVSAAPFAWLSVHAAYRLVPTIQDPALFGQSVFLAAAGTEEYRVIDFSSRLYPAQGESVDSFAFFHNLDRLFVTVNLPFADVFIGRQAVAWGSAHVFNPTDFLAPYAFTELDTEERRGVDAVRLRIPLGPLDELDLGYAAGGGFAWDKSAAYARAKTNFWDTDLSVLAAGFRGNLMLGIDITRSLGGAGVWLDAAYVFPRLLNTESGGGEQTGYLGMALGLDYNFDFGLYMFIEYYFNSAGGLKPDDYPDISSGDAYQDGAVYLLGRHYLNLGFTYQLHPLVPVSALIMWNVADFSFMINLSADYNLAENVYLAAGVFLGLGAPPKKIPLGPGVYAVLPASEFGTYPDIFYTSIRFYF
jgi:hypothetical protein